MRDIRYIKKFVTFQYKMINILAFFYVINLAIKTRKKLINLLFILGNIFHESQYICVLSYDDIRYIIDYQHAKNYLTDKLDL